MKNVGIKFSSHPCTFLRTECLVFVALLLEHLTHILVLWVALPQPQTPFFLSSEDGRRQIAVVFNMLASKNMCTTILVIVVNRYCSTPGILPYCELVIPYTKFPCPSRHTHKKPTPLETNIQRERERPLFFLNLTMTLSWNLQRGESSLANLLVFRRFTSHH